MKFCKPFIVNLLIFIPALLFYIFRDKKIEVSRKSLIILIIFGIGFGFVEAAGIIFLRGASNFLPGKQNLKIELMNLGIENDGQALLVKMMPSKLYKVEFIREIATMMMLISISIAAGKTWNERFMYFFWIFAIWDISYYLFLRVIIGWPDSLLSYDFLFLVPIPWYGQVWYPILVSTLTILVIIKLVIFKVEKR